MLAAVSACAPAASTGQSAPASTPVVRATTLTDLAFQLADADGAPARKAVYLRPLQQLRHRCAPGSVTAVGAAVETLAVGLASDRLVSAPRAASAAALAAASASASVSASGGSANCYALARQLLGEVDAPTSHSKSGWGGYAGQLSAWNAAHRADHRRPGWYLPRRTNGVDAYRVVGAGQILTMYEQFSPPLTAQLALASIERSLLPGNVRVVYSLLAAQCQQAVFMGKQLGALIGNPSLGAFVELTSGRGVGRTRYDAGQVDRARITPLGAIGGQPCT